MASFIEYFQNDLTEKGVDISQYGFYNRDTILYMSVPDDYKYYDRTDLQKFADGMLAKEHEAFMFGLRSTTSIMSAIRCFTLKRMMAVLLQVKNSMEK